MTFWKRKKLDSAELEHLAQQLRQMNDVELPIKEQQALKRQLFSVIESASGQEKNPEFLPQSLRVLGSRMEELGAKTMLSIPQRVKMKERVLLFIRKTDWLGLAFGPFHSFRMPRFLKTVVSGAMLFVFVVTSVFLFPFQVPLTYAARLTYIDDFTGQAFVVREGKIIEAEKYFSLYEGDVLMTGQNSSVTVRFFDDSVSRLDANTELEVKRLYSEPFNPVATQVELSLTDGRIWTRVLNLIDENSHFSVSTQNTSATVTKKAAFDLQTHVYSTTLSVFDNVVDFALGSDYMSQSRPVLAGFQAQVFTENGTSVTKIVPVAEGLKGDKEAARWIESNMEKDKLHTEVLVEENSKALEANSGMTDLLQQEEVLNSDQKLTNESIEQERQHFLDAYQRLLLGQTYLMRQQGKEGMELVLEFGATVRSIMVRYPEYKRQDPLNANLLFSFMEGRISQQRKDLATALPGDPLYPVKEELGQIQLFLAGSDVEKAGMQLSQSESKLLEVQDLIEKRQFEQAEAVLVRYQSQIDHLVLKVNSGNASELQDKLVKLFDQQIQQIKVLTSIEKSLFETQSDLLVHVRSLREQLLEKLMVAFEKVEGGLPLGLIQELQDILQTYMDNGAYDESFARLLNKMLVEYGRNDDGGESKLPTDLGVVTIVEEDATKAVQSQNEEEGSAERFSPPAEGSTMETESRTQQGCDASPECSREQD